MSDAPTGNGFSWRVRLGDVLTMALVFMTGLALMVQGFFGYMNLVERIIKVETKVDMMSAKSVESTPKENQGP